jgi:hypothetical protein
LGSIFERKIIAGLLKIVGMNMQKKDMMALMISFYMVAFVFYLACRNSIQSDIDLIIFLIPFILFLILPLFIPFIPKSKKRLDW